MDKLTLGFLADVLYLKEVICYEEFEAIQSVTNAEELGVVFEKMIGGEYNVYKRGESRPKQ